MRIFLILLFIPFFTLPIFGQSTGTIEYMAIKQAIPNIEFDLPNVKHWNLVADALPRPGYKGVIMFKRKPISDSEGRPIEPVMAILYQYRSDTLDVVEYSAGLLGTKIYNPKWELLGGAPEHSLDDHSAVFNAKYTRGLVEHSLILGYIKCNDFGIEITCDSTTDVFPQVENEMREFLKSVRIVDKD